MARALMTITDTAAARIHHLLSVAQTPAAGLRLSVKTKGCSGLAYNVEYAAAAQAGDERIESHGVTVFVDPAATLFLIGTQMDYEEGDLKSGFTFRNPNEAGRCGCGESFFVEKSALNSPDKTH
jgi:iron-sulfur cluster assembly protein